MIVMSEGSGGNVKAIPTNNPFLPGVRHQFNHVTVPYISVWLKRSIATILFCCCCFFMASEIWGDYLSPG